MTLQDITAPTLRTAELERFDRALQEATAIRYDQLDRLPPAEDDPIAAAQRVGFRQTLTEISAAQLRLTEGSFGSCTACREPIPLDRLEFRPWSATCVRCAGR